MKIYLSIDDTDNTESMGSGQLAEILAAELEQAQLAGKSSNITRHQLFFHGDIPYTSHNSAMCFSTQINRHQLDDIISFSGNFLRKNAAAGSDPGLCIALDDEIKDHTAIKQFGKKAKQNILTKEAAYSLSDQAGLHLSEHGGTGDGVIGALAGIGLRMSANDGRFRGWLRYGEKGEVVRADPIRAQKDVDDILDHAGEPIPNDSLIFLAEKKIKTFLRDNRQVVAVNPMRGCVEASWSTLSAAEVRQF